MKLNKLLEINPVLQMLIEQKVAVHIGFRINKTLNAIKPFLEEYDKQRFALLDSLGKISEDKSTYLFEGDNEAEFLKQLTVLLDEEVEVSLPTINVDDLKNVNIEPKHLFPLMDVIIKE